MSTLSAVFKNHKLASKVIAELAAHGLNRNDLTILTTENSSELNIEIRQNTKASEGIAAGVVAGGLIGVAISSLTGGLGFIAAGPIVAALAGAGGGAATGGLIGGLIGHGMPEQEARLVEEQIGKGYVMIGIKVPDDREDEIRTIFAKHSPDKIILH